MDEGACTMGGGDGKARLPAMGAGNHRARWSVTATERLPEDLLPRHEDCKRERLNDQVGLDQVILDQVSLNRREVSPSIYYA